MHKDSARFAIVYPVASQGGIATALDQYACVGISEDLVILQCSLTVVEHKHS